MYRKSWGLGLAAFLCLIVLAGSVRAEGGLKLEVTPLTLTVYGNSSATFRITILNQGGSVDDFIISVTGKSGWVNLDKYYVRLQAQKSANVNLMLTPLDVDGVYSYDIAVLSLTRPEIREMKTVYLTVLPQEDMPLIMESFDMEKADNELVFSIGINSSIKKAIDLDFTVKDSSGSVVTRDSLSGEVTGLKILAKRVKLPGGLLAGNYNVMVSVRGTELSQRASFSVEAVRNVKKTKTIISSPFAEEITITVSNQGNAVEEGYKLIETLPTSIIVSFVDPARCTLFETERECEWTLEALKPGEEASVTYRIEYWPFILIWGIVIIVIALTALGTAKKAVRPTIRKRAIRKGRGRYTIVLEIRNPFYYTLSNIMVRDWLTPLARVVKEFRGVKPVMRSSEAGTELIWRLEGIKPRDEIIIHYEITTIVHGQLKMPPASVKYMTHKGGKEKVYSRPLIIE